MSTKAKATKRAGSRDMTLAQWKWNEAKQNKVGYFMVAPYMILFTLFTIVPVFLSIFISFTDINPISLHIYFSFLFNFLQ